MREEKTRLREITYAEALYEAMREEMLGNEAVFVMGEDVALYGGAYKATKGLYEEFGEKRVKDTPISESTIVGTALGAAIAGLRPVAEIMFGDFLALAMDQIINQVAKAKYMSGGKVKVPLVIRSNIGARGSTAAQHSQSPHGWFLNVPGLKIVIPAIPYDAKGMLKTAIRDDNPVLFFEHKLLYPMKGPVPKEEYTVPLGKAEIRKEGKDITILAVSLMVHKVMKVTEELQREGISAEVIDLRSLVPLDMDTIVNSVKKTGKLLIVDEGCKTGGIGAEIAAQVMCEAFEYLDEPIERIGALDFPIPFSPPLEKHIIPDENRIIRAVYKMIKQ